MRTQEKFVQQLDTTKYNYGHIYCADNSSSANY